MHHYALRFKTMTTHISTLLKAADKVYFTDHHTLNKDITGVKSLKDIAELFNIYQGKFRLTKEVSIYREYKLQGTNYTFQLAFC